MTANMDLFIHPATAPIQPQQPPSQSQSRQPPKTLAPLLQATPSSLFPSPNTSSTPLPSVPPSTMSSVTGPFVLEKLSAAAATTSFPLSLLDSSATSSLLSTQASPSAIITTSPPPSPPSTVPNFPAVEATLVQLAKASKNNIDTDTPDIPFKIWRSRHMANNHLTGEHDNIPVDAPLPSTNREKYHRAQLRAIQLQRYQEWCIREGRQERRQQRDSEDVNDSNKNGLTTQQEQQRQEQEQEQQLQQDDEATGRRVRFTLPRKFKRSRPSSFADY